jgi:hypothetical protein
MAIMLKNISEEVMNAIYDKQNLLKKEKKRHVSLEQTVETMIKDAYLRKPAKQG